MAASEEPTTPTPPNDDDQIIALLSSLHQLSLLSSLETTVVPDNIDAFVPRWKNPHRCPHPGCTDEGLRSTPCRVCPHWLCKKHFTKKHHPCLRIATELAIQLGEQRDRRRKEDLIFRVMTSQLDVYALQLRPTATKCIVTMPQLDSKPTDGFNPDYLGGSYNVHFPLTFDEDETPALLARVRDDSPHRHPCEETLTTEYEVLKVLHQIAPELISAVWKPESLAPLRMLIVERKPGRPWLLHWFNPDVARTIKDLAAFNDKLSKVSFAGGVGSFTSGDTTTSLTGNVSAPPVGPFFGLANQPSGYGPFPTLAELHLARIDTFLAGLATGHKHFALQRSSGLLLHFLGHLELRELVAGDVELNTPGPSYIKNADGEQWLVREDGSIGGIIDWEFSYLTTFADAFASPRAFASMPENLEDPHHLSELNRALHDEYLTLGRHDLARAVENSHKYILLNVRLQTSRPIPLNRLIRLRALFLGPGRAGPTPQTSEQWAAMAFIRYGQHSEGLKRCLAGRRGWKKALVKLLKTALHQFEHGVEESSSDNKVAAEPAADADADADAPDPLDPSTQATQDPSADPLVQLKDKINQLDDQVGHLDSAVDQLQLKGLVAQLKTLVAQLKDASAKDASAKDSSAKDVPATNKVEVKEEN